jgi:hypothetical protein
MAPIVNFVMAFSYIYVGIANTCGSHLHLSALNGGGGLMDRLIRVLLVCLLFAGSQVSSCPSVSWYEPQMHIN